MPQQPRTAISVTVKQLDTVIEQAERFANDLKRVRETALNQPDKSLAIFYFDSAGKGLASLETFRNSAEKSRIAAELGRPFVAGQLKSRSTALKQGQAVSPKSAKAAIERKSSKKK